MTSAATQELRHWRDERLERLGEIGPALLIGGEWEAPSGSPTMETVDPSTAEPIADWIAAQPDDVDRAVRAAAAAAPDWAALPLTERAEHITRLRAMVADAAEELAGLDAIDGGMPLRSARKDVEYSLEQLRDWPGLALALRGETVALGDGMVHYTSYQPFGVVARIVAFNHPLYFAISGILPALLAGNSVVLKPAEQAPLSVLALGRLIRDAFPPGVVNIVTGDRIAGEALVTHPLVSRIAFTGSTATGLQIQRAAATGRVRTVSLELGGKNPMIVFGDVNVDAAVDGAINGMSFRGTQGQSCGSTSRVFVHTSIYDDFVDQLGARLEQLRVGVAYSEDVDVGPLVSARQCERVREFIQAGIDDGARLVSGGLGPPDGDLPGGYFVVPTLFSDVTMQMPIAREEIFGPVVCLLPWEDEAEVLKQANELEYGLTASVWTDSLSNALPVVERLQAGYVWVNVAGPHYWGTPFGGVGDSGVGREESLSELQSYLQVKAVHLGAGSRPQRVASA
jgi:acyl-CoA reductase-like NAD-dependent aldehyde dehydrogenase